MTPDALGRRFRSSLARFMSSAPQPGAGVSTAVDSPDAGSAAILPPFEERVRALQKALDMPFDNPQLLREALTHRSYLNEATLPVPSNERLEFLGDAVLGLISADFLFHRFPAMPEGELTNLRSALVRTESLAGYSYQLGLGRYLFLGRGEELSEGRTRPPGLAGASEALIGRSTSIVATRRREILRSVSSSRSSRQFSPDRPSAMPSPSSRSWCRRNVTWHP